MPVSSVADLTAHLRAFAGLHADRRDGDRQAAVRAASRIAEQRYRRALMEAERGAPASVVCRELDWFERILANCRHLIAAETRATPLEDWTPSDFSREEQRTA